MRRRVVLPFVLLALLFFAAWEFQAGLVAGQAFEPEPAKKAEREPVQADILALRVGAREPRLVVPRLRALEVEPPAAHPGAGPEAEPEAEPGANRIRGLRPRIRFVALRDGESIATICRRIYGDERRVDEVLRLNGLSREAARLLRAGRQILLP